MVREFAESEIAPHAARVGPRAPLPDRRRAADGQARPVRAHRAGGVRRRRRGRRLHQPLRRDRGARPGRPVDGHHPRGGRRARDQPDPHLRHRRAEAALAARPGRRASAGRLRPHRAGCRLRRAARRAPRPTWSTASGWSTAPSSSSPTPAPTSPRASRSTARTGERRGRQAGDLHDHRAGRHARLHRGAGVRQARLARLRHPPADFDDVRLPEDNLLGERGRGYAQFLATLDDGRVAIAALAVGCIQACLELARRSTPASASVRRPDRAQAGRGVPDRRPRGDAPRRRGC